MGLMLPEWATWLFEKLGYDWPDIDEEDLLTAATLSRTLKNEIESIMQHADQKISVEVPSAATGKAAAAYTAAWETNRDQNLNQMLDVLVPVPPGLEASAAVVLSLKGKMIAQLTIDVATMMPMIAAGPLGAAAFIAKKAASRIIMNIMVDMAVTKAVEVAGPTILEPLLDAIPGLIQRILDAPDMEDTGSEPGELKLDLDAMESIQEAMDECEAAITVAIQEYLAEIQALTFTE